MREENSRKGGKRGMEVIVTNGDVKGQSRNGTAGRVRCKR